MAITAAELIKLSALNRPEDDTSTGGGGIDVDHRPVMTQMAANDTLEMVSDNAGDTTQTVTITGRNAAGASISDVQTLDGTCVVSFSGTFERVQKVVMSADAVGIITVRRSSTGPTLSTIPVGERGFHIQFIDSASESGATTRWDKEFWKNTNGSLTLNNAAVELTADPSAKIQMGVHTSKDDSATITNRKTTPGVTFVDDSVSQAVPTGILATTEAISIWIQLDLTGSDTPYNSSYTTQLTGTSV